MKDHGCMSCHHVPFLLWSHRSAQAQGFTVDSQKLAEWDEWTRKDSLANRLLFRLRNYDLGRPEAETLTLAVKDKLKPLIFRPFQTEAEFLAELTPLLTEDEMKSHRATSFADAERWDLLFWQEQTPEDRLSALVAIRNDIRKVEQARGAQEA